MNVMVMVMNYGLVNIKVVGNTLKWAYADLACLDGEHWGVWMDWEEEDCHGSAQIPSALDKDDVCDMVDGVLLNALGAPNNTTWMTVY